ncbi:MAG: hypothetical protein V4550_21385 [Gemmatimonadota bacterium]
MIRRILFFTVLAAPLLSASVEAQGGRANRPVQVRPGQVRPARRLPPQLPPDVPVARRQQLEQQIRRGFWRVAKQRIGFTDEQMMKLEATSQRFDQRRRLLGQQEKAQRVALRRETLLDSAANQATIAAAIDQLMLLQRQRAEVQADEQKEFATFMTPIQRSKFLGLQENLKKRMQEMLKARPDSAAVDPESP